MFRPYFNMVRMNFDETVELVCPPQDFIARRQDSPLVYDITTVCYVINPKFVQEHDALFEGRVKAIVIPVERAIDIDTLLDFKFAEALLDMRLAGETP